MRETVISEERLIFKKSNRYTQYFVEWAILFVLIALVVAASIFVEGFFDTNNFINIIRQISFLAIIAMGQFFVVLIGGVDMSAGSTISFISVFIATLMGISGVPMVVAIVLAIASGVIIGLINGVLSVFGRVSPFIATLITMIVLQGVNYLYSGGVPISGLPREFNQLGAGYVGFIPVPVIILIIITILCYILTNKMEIGRSLYAVGGNEEASRLSGLNTNKIKLTAFVLSSTLTAVGAILITSRTMAGQPALGTNMLFDVITIVVLGGTSLSGGKGKILGVLIAALILGVIDNVMVLLGVGAYWQLVVKGLILAVVVLIDSLSKKRV